MVRAIVKVLRTLELVIGVALLLVWAWAFLWILGNFAGTPCGYEDQLADCSDLRRGTFFLATATSPLFVVGVALTVSGLPYDRLRTPGWRVCLGIVEGCCFLAAAGFPLSGFTFLADIDVPGMGQLVGLLFGCALLSAWSGIRLERRRVGPRKVRPLRMSVTSARPPHL